MRKKPVHPFAAVFRFLDELNDFLPKERSGREFSYAFRGKPSIKDAIEANQVPHTEVGCIMVNGTPVDFSYHLLHEDRVAVYPERSDVSRSSPVRLRPLPAPAFIADVHLGKLARHLRLLGFDVAYDQTLDDPEIITCAVDQRRIILTRDRHLLHAKVIVHGCCLHHQEPIAQLREVIDRYDLKERLKPFSRCLVCNGILQDVAKERIIERLEPKTCLYYEKFKLCGRCGKIFWRGSHCERLREVLEDIDFKNIAATSDELY
ncbi:MAG: Mut7-C ubiquitin/RNAse domain-containing protein [Chitinispirillaceae bacterium]|nr:Mut7-C ubiquitin/RNAse domain-containing protein [Chitinispirillaceae bacterium]